MRAVRALEQEIGHVLRDPSEYDCNRSTDSPEDSESVGPRQGTKGNDGQSDGNSVPISVQCRFRLIRMSLYSCCLKSFAVHLSRGMRYGCCLLLLCFPR